MPGRDRKRQREREDGGVALHMTHTLSSVCMKHQGGQLEVGTVWLSHVLMVTGPRVGGGCVWGVDTYRFNPAV